LKKKLSVTYKHDMIELYVLGTLSAMGYLLNKTSTTVTTKSNVISKNEIPSVDSIYSANHTQRVKEIEERKAAKVYEMAKKPSKTNVISKNYGALKQDEFTSGSKLKSLTGDYVSAEEFTHNNMVPFFGGNIKQSLNENASKNILEKYTGVSELFQNKKEQASMSDQVKDFSYVNGMDNKDDFYRERLAESRNKNNIVPVPQVRVGPGVGQGYDATPTGGFHQFDAQDVAMSYYKPVDELRVASNPKSTFEGRTVDGQKGKNRAEAPNLVKNRVETFYEKTPDMLFKTTGAYTKPTDVPEFNVKTTGRQGMKDFGVRNVAMDTYGTGEKHDYGKSKILVYSNERDITTTRVHQGNLQSLVKAIVAPLQDVLRVNKKEHAVDNPRHFGNMSVQIPDKPTIYDPNDVARTTIKETLIHDEMGMGTVTGPKKLAVYDPDEIAKKTLRETLESMDYEMNVAPNVPKGVVYDPEDGPRTTMKETLVTETHEGNIDRLEGMGDYVNDYVARNTQKQFYSDNDYYGVSASAYNKKEMSKQDIANAVISERKEVTLFGREPTKEGKKVANGSECISMAHKKMECDMTAVRATANQDRIGQLIPDLSQLNITKDKSHYQVPDNRLDPSLLNAFNENPYTQSLQSVY
jgi:hypothetical protein